MKIVIKLFLVLIVVLSFVKDTNAMDFAEGYENSAKKPMIMLVYANWAENFQGHLDVFNDLKAEYEDQYNFVELDIAKPEAKAFNDKFHIYPKLPYMLMYRDGGKVSRYIQRECAIEPSCVESRIRTFLQ